jgi:hypothetical protein
MTGGSLDYTPSNSNPAQESAGSRPDDRARAGPHQE